MSSFEDLKQALRENLEARGVMARFEAAMRAELFHAIDEDLPPAAKTPKESAVVNELVREYLRYNGYGHTLSVFAAEARLPKDPSDREYLSQELGVHPRLYPPAMPLLYGLAFKHKTLTNPDRVVAEQQAHAAAREAKWSLAEDAITTTGIAGGVSPLPARRSTAPVPPAALEPERDLAVPVWAEPVVHVQK